MNAAVKPACACYSTTNNDGLIIPVLCRAHEDELQRKLCGYRYSVPKYQRYFATEDDAIDRARIIYNMKPAEGYGTLVSIIPISDWWLVRAHWSDSCE